MKNFWLERNGKEDRQTVFSEDDVKCLAAMYCNRVMDDRHDDITRMVEKCGGSYIRESCTHCYPTYGAAADLFKACRRALKKKA